MWKCVVVCAVLWLASGECLMFDPYVDINLVKLRTSADRIRGHGYPSQHYHVETSDGYVLGLFRIPYSPKLNNQEKKKPVVFIQHGLFSCSDCFLLNGPENALAFNFADAGYDVWLGNARGNIYSLNNTKTSVKHPNFWKFSWHEIGTIDMPETIDFILKETGESTLHYVGHSQGGTVYFVMLSSRPEYNAKIRTAHLLAPAVFMGNTTHDLVHLFKAYVSVPGGRGTRLLDNQPFIPQNFLVQRFLDTACGQKPAYPEYCKTLFMLWAGTEATNINSTLLPQIAETHPAGISTNQGIHYIHISLSNMFRQYDHGVKGNRQRYGQDEPPDYPLDKISAKTYVYYGLSDTSVNYKDVERLPDYLKSLEELHQVPDPTWSHIDFIFAMRVKEYINDKVIQQCQKYEAENSK